MMHTILALWATPRSTSTAFEWVMSNRNDMRCFHEPYNEAYYLGEDRRNDRYFVADPGLSIKPGLNFRSVHARLSQLASSERVFIKDFAYSVTHMADDDFLDSFEHTFLIRDPEKVITSMHARWPDAELDEVGFEDLHTLCRRVMQRYRKPPVVVDSDDLLNDPEAGMKAYCEAVGIAHIDNSTKWKRNQLNEKKQTPTWSSHAYEFHDQLRSSSGLAKQERRYRPIDSSEDMLRLYAAAKPHYDALYQLRLRF